MVLDDVAGDSKRESWPKSCVSFSLVGMWRALHIWGLMLWCTVGACGALSGGDGVVWDGSIPAPRGEMHPFVLMRGSDLDGIRARVTRAPARMWFAAVKASADASLALQEVPPAAERLMRARELGLVYVLTGEAAYAKRSAEWLAGTTLFESFSQTNEQVHTLVGQVPKYCEAYDLLKTSSADARSDWSIDKTTDAAIRANIARMAVWLRGYRPFWYDFVRNNWGIRQYAALCLCAMVLADGVDDGWSAAEVGAWYRWSYAEMMRALDVQIGPGGAVAEGLAYMNYAADNYLPMMFACRNSYRVDLFANPAVRQAHRWLVELRMPSGYLPNFDDAPLGGYPTHYLTSVSQGGEAGRFAWDWQSAGSPVFDPVRAICWYDDTITATPPVGPPSVVRPEAGTAVLRSAWSDDALYLLLLGEHGAARVNGFGHEHPDNTSFILEAFGEQLAIDGGYIDFAHHALVNRPYNHNLVLVDGAGPLFVQVDGQPLVVDEDAFLVDHGVDGDMPRCSVRMSYGGMDMCRTVLMPRRRYYVLIDRLSPVAGGIGELTPPIRRFDWLLHGNAGVPEQAEGTGGSFAVDGSTARWTRPSGVCLQVNLVSSRGGLLFQERKAVDGVYFAHQATGHGPESILRHRAVAGTVRGSSVVFVALLLPARKGADLPTVSHRWSTDAIGFEVIFPDRSRETIRVMPAAPSACPAPGLYDVNTFDAEGHLLLSATGGF